MAAREKSGAGSEDAIINMPLGDPVVNQEQTNKDHPVAVSPARASLQFLAFPREIRDLIYDRLLRVYSGRRDVFVLKDSHCSVPH